WKGAGLSLVLDMLAVILSGGLSTAEVSKLKTESSLSQVFIAFKLTGLSNFPAIQSALNAIADDYRSSQSTGPAVRYPGEGVLKARAYNREHGIPVLAGAWREIQAL
ncbi:MAG: 2,3-diketo-L-gulonate reductase, partial [Bacteroidia bacterium]|nr:2,3-diketo-L-gulonate reductase [Bacteroidia bacterium]